MAKFELETLAKYDDQSLLAELRRVAALIPEGKLKRSEFDRLSKVHSSTLHARFGTWRNALVAARLSDRFDDSTEAWSRGEIICEYQRVARVLGHNYVTKRELAKHAGISDRPIRRLFGSQRAALEAAGLSQCPGGFRYTNEECYENLLAVWTALGRQPSFSDMKDGQSRVGPKAYVSRWRSWRKALEAFVEWANRDAPSAEQQPTVTKEKTPAATDASVVSLK